MEVADGGVVEDVTDEAMAVAHPEQRRLQRLRAWLEGYGVQMRSCEIRRSGGDAGLGVFASEENGAQGVLMVVPLALAITPTSVMQDPELGEFFMGLVKQGDADDRQLVILFLLIERARGQISTWAPWLDVMPSVFGTSICFSEDELSELKGTPLFVASKLRIKTLELAFENSVKPFADFVLSHVKTEKREVDFQDFLWANCIFWARAKSMPCPRSVIFPAQLTPRPALQSSNVAPSDGGSGDGFSESLRSFQSGTNDGELSVSNDSTHVELEEGRLADENDFENAPTGQRLDGAVLESSAFQIGTIDREISTYYGEAAESEDERAPCPSLADGNDRVGNSEAGTHRGEGLGEVDFEAVTKSSQVIVEGLVPGIDFCNHDYKSPNYVSQCVIRPEPVTERWHPSTSFQQVPDRTALALWEIDGPDGNETGVPNAMYLFTTRPEPGVPLGEEIHINYGHKGNEELLITYGFVVEDNPDDYLMINFPVRALEETVCSDFRKGMLEQLSLPLRWIIPSSKLRRGFYEKLDIDSTIRVPSAHSWSGRRKTSPLENKLVFPEELLSSLRIISLQEHEVYDVGTLLEEITDREAGRFPTDVDMMAAVWEVVGNTGAFQLLIDLLTSRSMALEEGTGTEAMDAELLSKDKIARSQMKDQSHRDRNDKGDGDSGRNLLSDNKRAAVIYRMGQKSLVRRFLREAEMALEVCLDYISD